MTTCRSARSRVLHPVPWAASLRGNDALEQAEVSRSCGSCVVISARGGPVGTCSIAEGPEPSGDRPGIAHVLGDLDERRLVTARLVGIDRDHRTLPDDDRVDRARVELAV